MKSKFIVALLLCLSVTAFASTGTMSVNAAQTNNSVNAGASAAISTMLVSGSNASVAKNEADTTAEPEVTTIYGYTNLGIANVDNYLNIRESASEEAEMVGKMPAKAACEIIGQEGDWSQITSGEVTGYVKTEFLATGDQAAALAAETVKTIADVNTTTLNIRSEANTESSILAQVGEGGKLTVTENQGDWVKVAVDDQEGYVSAEFVTVSEQLETALTMTEVKYGAGVSDVRVDLVAYALQFVGNRYVWGGTSLTNGVDCSGFTMQIMAKYGVSLPHSSAAQPASGTKIDSSQLKPGDLIFYGSGSHINHVAIYIGGGQIVHASSAKTGIKISNAFYRTPICCVSYLGN